MTRCSQAGDIVEATGPGTPRWIIRGMKQHNNAEPDLIEDDDRFLVRLWK